MLVDGGEGCLVLTIYISTQIGLWYIQSPRIHSAPRGYFFICMISQYSEFSDCGWTARAWKLVHKPFDIRISTAPWRREESDIVIRR